MSSRLTAEGVSYLTQGSPEYQLFSVVPADRGISQHALQTNYGPLFRTAYALCRKRQWLAFDKSSKTISRAVDQVTDVVVDQLRIVRDTGTHPDSQVLTMLRKRCLVE